MFTQKLYCQRSFGVAIYRELGYGDTLNIATVEFLVSHNVLFIFPKKVSRKQFISDN